MQESNKLGRENIVECVEGGVKNTSIDCVLSSIVGRDIIGISTAL
jgi:hypothetical protein